MGLFRLVARVDCLRGGATCLLEEWSHRRFGAGQNPAYRPSGVSFVFATPAKSGEAIHGGPDCIVALLLAMTGAVP